MTGDAPRLARGAGLLLGASILIQLLAALTMLILTRILAPADFGLVALATTLLAILATMTELQLGSALIQMRQVGERDYDTVFSVQLLRGMAVGAALLAGGHVLASAYAEPRLIGICYLLALDPVLAAFRSPRFVNFDKQLRFGVGAVLDIAGRATSFLVIVAVALATRSYWAIPLGQIAATAAVAIGSNLAAPHRFRLSLSNWRPILRFAMWLNLNGIVTTVAPRLDNFLVAGFSSKAVLGQYVVGNQLAALASEGLAQPLQRAFFPGFASAGDDRARLRALYLNSQAWLASIVLPVGVLCALLAEPGVRVALGPRWTVAIEVIVWVAPVFGIQSIFGPVGAVALALGETRALFRRSLLVLCVRIPAVVLGLWLGGLTGLLIARLLASGVLAAIIDAYLAGRLLSLSPRELARGCWRPVLGVGVMVLAGLAWRALVPLPQPVVPLIVYAVALGAVSALGYVVAVGLLWIAAGRPHGPEHYVAERLVRHLQRGDALPS